MKVPNNAFSRMSRRNFLAGLGACALGQPVRHPNIVFILADDLGYGDLSCYGGPVLTENLDKLARKGMRFTNAHSAAVCSAARCALLTGKYAQRQGDEFLQGVVQLNTTTGLTDLTLANLLGFQGYRTGMVGKWHLGHAREEFLPLSRGFQSYRGVPYSNNMFPLWEYSGNNIIGSFDEKLPELTPSFTDYALEFIGAAKKFSTPYFLYLAFTSPHEPLAPSKEFVGSSGYGAYYDSVLELDAAVGKVLAELDDNTLVIFASDNGADITRPADERGSNGGFLGGKFGVAEGGICIPLIAYWPNRIPAESTCTELVSLMDFWPTLGRISGYDGADSVITQSDGVDITNLLSGDASEVYRPHALIHFINGLPLAAAARVRGLNVKIRFNRTGAPELFNMGEDIQEAYNIASQYPDIVQYLLDDVRQQLISFPKTTNRI